MTSTRNTDAFNILRYNKGKNVELVHMCITLSYNSQLKWIKCKRYVTEIHDECYVSGEKNDTPSRKKIIQCQIYPTNMIRPWLINKFSHRVSPIYRIKRSFNHNIFMVWTWLPCTSNNIVDVTFLMLPWQPHDVFKKMKKISDGISPSDLLIFIIYTEKSSWTGEVKTKNRPQGMIFEREKESRLLKRMIRMDFVTWKVHLIDNSLLSSPFKVTCSK